MVYLVQCTSVFIYTGCSSSLRMLKCNVLTVLLPPKHTLGPVENHQYMNIAKKKHNFCKEFVRYVLPSAIIYRNTKTVSILKYSLADALKRGFTHTQNKELSKQTCEWMTTICMFKQISEVIPYLLLIAIHPGLFYGRDWTERGKRPVLLLPFQSLTTRIIRSRHIRSGIQCNGGFPMT